MLYSEIDGKLSRRAEIIDIDVEEGRRKSETRVGTREKRAFIDLLLWAVGTVSVLATHSVLPNKSRFDGDIQ